MGFQFKDKESTFLSDTRYIISFKKTEDNSITLLYERKERELHYYLSYINENERDKDHQTLFIVKNGGH